jgi:integrase
MATSRTASSTIEHRLACHRLELFAARRAAGSEGPRHRDRQSRYSQQARHPTRQKEAILPEDLIAMLETLVRGKLCGMRGRAMLLVGFAGGLRHSEITGLDFGRDQAEDSRGWIEISYNDILVGLRGETAGSRSRSAAAPRMLPAWPPCSKPGSIL